MCSPPEANRLIQLQHAGALVGFAVYFNQALLAHAHATKKSPLRSTLRGAQPANSVRRKRRSQAFAGPAVDGLTFEVDFDGWADGRIGGWWNSSYLEVGFNVLLSAYAPGEFPAPGSVAQAARVISTRLTEDCRLKTVDRRLM